ncbi:hypothetical protein ACFQY0_10045 [Haloferula chungangensis]|uniref:Uncharacterized protein n=1 Tax=Haloferula chungangensis TaxID=1048331 RepID=A0ABW2L7Q8_9BACT
MSKFLSIARAAALLFLGIAILPLGLSSCQPLGGSDPLDQGASGAEVVPVLP